MWIDITNRRFAVLLGSVRSVENIFETYYTAHLWRGIYVGPDLEHLQNPGYNRETSTGPRPSFRLHVEL